jgi:hypothetical protein
VAPLKIFVGSSSDSEQFAKWVKIILERGGGVEVKGWWDGLFKVSRTYIQTLEELLLWADASVFIFSEDDHLTQRGDAVWAPRDNVVFEYGMFLAGQKRGSAAFAKLGNPAIPSDLGGVIHLRLKKIDDEESFIDENDAEVYRWIEPVKRGHKSSTTVPPLTGIGHENLGTLGESIVAAVGKSIRYLINRSTSPQLEPEYWESLIRDEINNLSMGDALWAICGAKNYELPEVCEYLNENIALAERGVSVHRLYVAPHGQFEDRELEVIETHLEWAEKLGDKFKVGVLVGKGDCKRLLEMELPQRFGMVLTRRRDEWRAHIHFPDPQDKEKQVGWLFGEEVVVLILRMLFEDTARRARRRGVPDSVTNDIREKLNEPGYVRKESLWRQGKPKPRL